MAEPIETVIIGGGQAGLAMSYHLGQHGREHVVLERGRIAERWRSERWDSLRFQFPNWMMKLPGWTYEGSEPDGFMPRDGVVRFIEEYARRISAPVRCGIRVVRLHATPRGALGIETDHFRLQAANVVVATGPYQLPLVPACSAALPLRICQVTASRYTNAGALPPGNVLVVGSGGSGCQIAEDLLESGRGVYLCVGRHRRVPRRYRGKDFGWWQEKTGASERSIDELPPETLPPLLTGMHGGKDVDLRDLAARGVTLLGGLRGICDGRLYLASDLEQNLAGGDAAFHQYARSVDQYILEHGLAAALEPQPDAPATNRLPRTAASRGLQIASAGITSVIWAVGYRHDFGWMQCTALDACGKPLHRRGISPVPGVYFLGLPRLSKVKSAFLWGVGEDAAYLAGHIVNRSRCAFSARGSRGSRLHWCASDR